jgi:two-component system, cell cycle sensor histidine kinase and response regulator CckA
VLAVSDTGKGMDAETRTHLFEPFFTTKELGKGTGLGLATVFGIVKQNQGLISVYSEPDYGSTFKIFLPRSAMEISAASSTARVREMRGTETVLLVEDELQILNLGRRILEQYGYTVLAASTPEAALALAAQSSAPIHLLITDVVMPGMNGKELNVRLRVGRPGLRCIFMSGYTADVIAHHGVLEAGVAFLQKPFTIQSLAEKVREVLDAQRTPSSQ